MSDLMHDEPEQPATAHSVRERIMRLLHHRLTSAEMRDHLNDGLRRLDAAGDGAVAEVEVIALGVETINELARLVRLDKEQRIAQGLTPYASGKMPLGDPREDDH